MTFAGFAAVTDTGCGSDSASNPPFEVCKNPTALESKCSDCLGAKCASLVSSCSSFFSCTEPCDCAADQCVLACTGSYACETLMASSGAAACSACGESCGGELNFALFHITLTLGP
jgi:hypothetical protein